jgi:hypothetical protein
MNSPARPQAIYSQGPNRVAAFFAKDYQTPLILSLNRQQALAGRWPALRPGDILTLPERPLGEGVLAGGRVQAEQLMLLPESRSLESYIRPAKLPPRDFEALAYVEYPDPIILELILDAWWYVIGRRPHSRLLLVANPALRPQWEASAKHLGLKDRVLFVDQVEQVYSLLWRSRVYLGLSLENQHPQILFAALVGGCWPLCISQGWGGHLIQAGHNGDLIPPEGLEAKALAAQILAYLEMDLEDEARARQIIHDFSRAGLEEAWGEVLGRLGSAAEV